jgi:hypothetical protein
MIEKIAAAAATAAPQAPAAGADFSGQLSRQLPTATSGVRPAATGQGAMNAVSKAHGQGAAPAPARTAAGRSAAGTAGAEGAAPSAPAVRRPIAALAATSATRSRSVAPAQKPGGAELLTEVQKAQQRLDQLLKLAESGRSFSPAELLAFQAHTYRASQELEMASKVVEKGTAALKQTLQTQI